MDEQELEKHLKSALSREEAPAWFEARVMNAVNANRQAAPVGSPRSWWQWVAGMAIAGLAVIGVGAEWSHHVAEERMKEARFEMEQNEAGQAAKAQLQLALRVTSTKLVEIQRRVAEAQQDN